MAASPTAPLPPSRPKRATGTHLYRYGSRHEWLESVILKHQIYVPDLSQLNDPADGRPPFARLSDQELFSHLFGDRVGVLHNRPDLNFDQQIAEGYILDYNIHLHGAHNIQRKYKEIFDTTMSDYKVYCLSKRYDNMNMWAKYADNHHGYCLEFANRGEFFSRAMEVAYGDFPPMNVTNDSHINANWLFCKGTQWSNEEEARILLVPRKSPHEVTIGPHCLTRIIVGWKMPEADRAQINEWAKQRQSPLTVVTASWDTFENKLTLV